MVSSLTLPTAPPHADSRSEKLPYWGLTGTGLLSLPVSHDTESAPLPEKLISRSGAVFHGWWLTTASPILLDGKVQLPEVTSLSAPKATCRLVKASVSDPAEANSHAEGSHDDLTHDLQRFHLSHASYSQGRQEDMATLAQYDQGAHLGFQSQPFWLRGFLAVGPRTSLPPVHVHTKQ